MRLDLKGYRAAKEQGVLLQVPIQWAMQEYRDVLPHGGLGRPTLQYTPVKFRDESIEEWTFRLKIENLQWPIKS